SKSNARGFSPPFAPELDYRYVICRSRPQLLGPKHPRLLNLLGIRFSWQPTAETMPTVCQIAPSKNIVRQRLTNPPNPGRNAVEQRELEGDLRLHPKFANT